MSTARWFLGQKIVKGPPLEGLGKLLFDGLSSGLVMFSSKGSWVLRYSSAPNFDGFVCKCLFFLVEMIRWRAFACPTIRALWA